MMTSDSVLCQDSMLLIDKMDPQGFIMYRLYKDHMRYENGELIKASSHKVARVLTRSKREPSASVLRTFVSSPKSSVSLVRGCRISISSIVTSRKSLF
jgi:hypothetical protein